MIFARYSSDQQEERRIRRWRTGLGPDPAWAQLQGYQYAQVPEIIGGMVAAEQANGIKWGAVWTGLATGVGVWLVTRLLDRAFHITK